MRHPNKKLVFTFILSTLIGYALSYAFMIFVLQSTYRVYGPTLHIVAILLGLVLVIVLDTPLQLKTFEWPANQPTSRTAQIQTTNSLAVSSVKFLVNIITLIFGVNTRVQFLASDGETIIDEFEVIG